MSTSTGYPYVMTRDGITVSMPDGSNKSITSNDPRFTQVVEIIREKRWEDLESLLDMKKSVEDYGREGGDKSFEVRDGVVFVDGEALPDALSSRIVDFMNHKLPYEPLLKFWANLQLNPSFRAVNDLYAYLEANKHPITEDGCFIGYRGVTADWKDHYTRKMDNSIGAVVKMPRNKVDEDPNVTCSRGLHVASFEYANSSYGTETGGHTVAVIVNPKDVVAIPVDYNNAKIRVCEFKIDKEIEKSLNDHPLYRSDECDEDDCGCHTFESENSGDTDYNEEEDYEYYDDESDYEDDDENDGF